MRKITVLLLCALLCGCMVMTASAYYTQGGLYFTIDNGSITIVGAQDIGREVTVPAAIAGYPVNTIASGAFPSSSVIKVVNLPDSVTTVELGAFAVGIQVNFNYNQNTTPPASSEPSESTPPSATGPSGSTPPSETGPSGSTPPSATGPSESTPPASTAPSTGGSTNEIILPGGNASDSTTAPTVPQQTTKPVTEPTTPSAGVELVEADSNVDAELSFEELSEDSDEPLQPDSAENAPPAAQGTDTLAATAPNQEPDESSTAMILEAIFDLMPKALIVIGVLAVAAIGVTAAVILIKRK